MNCGLAQQVIDAYLDGELDAATRQEMSEHLARCQDCARLHAERASLNRQIAAVAPRYEAPASLRRRVERIAGERMPGTSRRVPRPSWLQAALYAVLAAALGLIGGYQIGRSPQEQPPIEAIVAHHTAALREGYRLVDIASGDRHTVKPWLQGRIDYAPRVADLAQEGYKLLGARLDRIEERPAAVIVYQLRKHVISVFVWRAAATAPQALASSQARGFSVAAWSEGGLCYTAISDVESRDLVRFARLVLASAEAAR